MKLLILGFMCLLFVSASFIYISSIEEKNEADDKIYQGPVPEGYDLEYFRKTGETVMEVSE